MANTDPYISDSLDYIYLDINQTTLEPTPDPYSGWLGHTITSTEYLSVLSSPQLTYGRKYFVYCAFFVSGAEEDYYNYRIVDGLGSPLPDGVFTIRNTKASGGTGYDDTTNNGTYGSWFKVFHANSNSPIYFETKANGVDNFSAVYYAQFLTIDITELDEDYHYFYKEDTSITIESQSTSYTIQPDENNNITSDWLAMASYSNLKLIQRPGTVNFSIDGNSMYADDGAFYDGDDLQDDTNRPKTMFRTTSLSSSTDVSLSFNPISGQLFYPKIFGLRMDLFNDSFISGEKSIETLYTCDLSSSLDNVSMTAKDSEYFILGQIAQDGIFSHHSYVDSWPVKGGSESFQSSHVAASGNFGNSISMSGTYAIIGESGYITGGDGVGAASIWEFKNDSWLEQKFMTPAVAANKDGYGDDVAIDGNTAAIGHTGEDVVINGILVFDAGSVHFWERSSDEEWELISTVHHSDGATGDNFGNSVDVSGSQAVIGAWKGDQSNVNGGRAYVFERIDGSWLEDGYLISSDNEAGDYFGNEVSIYNDTIAVGAYNDDNVNGTEAGCVYIFEKPTTAQVNPLGASSFAEVAKIVASDGVANDHFGVSISMDGDILAIGAYKNNAKASDSGAVYIFEKQCSSEEWKQTAKIYPGDGAAGDHFGYSISLNSNTLVVGAPDAYDPSTGKSYVYERKNADNWFLVETFAHTGGSTGDQFGISVAIYGKEILIGAQGDDTTANAAGEVFAFHEGSTAISVNTISNLGISCEVSSGNSSYSYPIENFSIVHSIDDIHVDLLELDPDMPYIRNQIIPISLHIPSVGESFSAKFTAYNNSITDDISFNNFNYAILSNKVKRYAPISVPLQGKSLHDIYPDMMVCSYTNSGIDPDSSILGGFDTQDPRNYVIDGLGNKLPFRWSSTMKDYFFDRGRVENPLMDQELHHVLSLGNIPERPYPFRTDIFDIDEYNCLSATIYDDATISLRSKYFEDDIESINETIEFYMILDKQEWYEGDDPITIGEYKSYNDDGVSPLRRCPIHSDTCLLKLNFTDWNLSSSEKKIFHFFTHNVKNESAGDIEDAKKDHSYWFAREIKPASNSNRISRHFNYEDVFIEDTATDFLLTPDIRKKSKFVFKDSSLLTPGETHQSNGRVRSFQATDIFNDKDELNLATFIDRTEEDLRNSLEFQLLGAGSNSSDPYYYATLDSSDAMIYFYMPPDWARLHLAYKLIDIDLFTDEQPELRQWDATEWTSSLFSNYVAAISRRLKVLREALVEGKHSSTFSYNRASRVGLYAHRTNFYGQNADVETLNTADYLMQHAYELATSDYDLLKYADYLQVELFPRWGSLDSYSDDDLENYIDMHLEYASKVIDKETTSICRLFPLITHKVRNSSSSSYLMVLTKDEILKFINRIDYHVDKINYSFWEYGIYNESSYGNNYVTPSDTTIDAGEGYAGAYIDSYPWTTNNEDPNALQIDESLQPYLNGGTKENTTLVCYFYSLFVAEGDEPLVCI